MFKHIYNLILSSFIVMTTASAAGFEPAPQWEGSIVRTVHAEDGQEIGYVTFSKPTGDYINTLGMKFTIQEGEPENFIRPLALTIREFFNQMDSTLPDGTLFTNLVAHVNVDRADLNEVLCRIFGDKINIDPLEDGEHEPINAYFKSVIDLQARLNAIIDGAPLV